MAQKKDLIESFVPVVRYYGLKTEKAVTLGSTVSITGALSVADLTGTGGLTLKSATAVPASAGAVAAGAPLTLFTSGPSLYVTSDVPAFSAIKGSICVNTAGSSSSTRLYVNNGTTNWVAITTAT